MPQISSPSGPFIMDQIVSSQFKTTANSSSCDREVLHSQTSPSILRSTSFKQFWTTETVGPTADSFQQLPNEVLLLIFTHLDPEDLLACSCVNHRWRLIASDWHLWQIKLWDSMSRHWNTIVCPEQPLEHPLLEPNSVHPKEIYRFLTCYIPHCQLTAAGEEVQDDKQEDLSPQINIGSLTYNNFPFTDFLSHCWNQVRNFIPFSSNSAASSSSLTVSTLSNPSQRPRFALFGPGFDHRETNKLFWKMVNKRTKSFEPINMFTGHMGFGSGITMRLFAQAQQAAMDSSIRATPPKFSTSAVPTRDLSSRHRRQLNCLSLPPRTNASSPSATSTLTPTAPLGVHHADLPHQQCCDQHQDFTFDLSYLYSLPAHLNHVFSDQYSRLSVSRLFMHTLKLSEQELVTTLQVTEEMKELCRNLNGLVYVIDARASTDQLAYLYYELRAVLRGFPADVADRIPIVVLYIMPAEVIRLSMKANNRRNAEMLRKLPKLMANRDSYSGSEYTAAWHDSLLLPISSLRLFDLANPWRLQKCSSNDLKTLIQSIMWLNNMHVDTHKL